MVEFEVPPAPDPDADSAGFWEATTRGELAIARCLECRRWAHPPVERCPRCASPMAFEPVSRRGVVFSRISVHKPMVPGYLRDLPHAVLLVELVEQQGLRLPVRVSPEQGDPLRIGDAVTIVLEELAGYDHRIPTAVPAQVSP